MHISNMADRMEYEDCVLKVNNTYATKFKRQNEKAELDKLQQKYGKTSFEDENEDSSSESEDEDAKELDDEKEKDFLKTLAMIKNKDPQIYNKDTKFYCDSDNKIDTCTEERKSDKTAKPLYLKDYERERLLKKGSKAFVDEDISEDENSQEKSTTSLTYIEEQEEIKKSFKDVLTGIDDENDDFLSKRKKSKHEMQVEDQNYFNWLKRRKLNENDTKQLEPLMKLWSDPNLDDDEKFLRNFILQKKYIDNESDEVPTYDELVQDFDKEETQLEQQEEFERKYNFRFEEPESSQLKSYPRDVLGSLRRQDNRRKEKRQSTKERKLQEKEEKKQELKRLKNLKKKEILEKLEKLKEVTGNPNIGFNDHDIDGDFDPIKYDEAMEKAFNDEYYNEDENEKPEFEADDWEGYEEENWDEWDGQVDENEETCCEEPNFNMDADYEMNYQPVDQKKKRKSVFSKAVHTTKPQFDPNEKTFEEYFDEYYKLDYEDIVGDLPCRFKYRQVEPNDFGLTVDEILQCDDHELNQWASLKKSIQYRTKEEEKKDLKRYRQRAKDLKKKMVILKSLSNQKDEENVVSDSEKEEELNEGKLPDKVKSPSNKMSHKKLFVQNLEQHLVKSGKKIQGETKWRWKGKFSQKDRRELNQKRRLMRHFRGAKIDKVSQLSSSRLRCYGVDKKKKRKANV